MEIREIRTFELRNADEAFTEPLAAQITFCKKSGCRRWELSNFDILTHSQNNILERVRFSAKAAGFMEDKLTELNQ